MTSEAAAHTSFKTLKRINPHASLPRAIMKGLMGMAVLPALALVPSSSFAAAEYPLDILGPDVEDLGWTPGMAPTAIEAEIEDVSEKRRGYVKLPGVSDAFDFTYDHLDELYNKTGLRIGAAYTMLFQGLSGGPWDRFGGAGDFDLMTSWTLVGRGTENTGRFLFDFEERFQIGPRTPNVLGAGVATLVPTANTFNDRGLVVRDLFWEQRLYKGQVRFMIGRADSTDYFASTWMQSANISFVNRMFASPSTIAAPGHGPAVGMSYRPTEKQFYVSGGAANAYGSTTTTGISSLVDNWTFFSYGEVGWTPDFENFGEGRYTVSGWHMGERTVTGVPADWGITVVADQQLNETVDLFARYGFANEATLGVKSYIQGGAGFRVGLMEEKDDKAGVAFSYAFPSNNTFREEKVFETFYRLQATRFAQLSAGAQAIIDPADGAGHDVVGAFWGRLRVTF